MGLDETINRWMQPVTDAVSGFIFLLGLYLLGPVVKREMRSYRERLARY